MKKLLLKGLMSLALVAPFLLSPVTASAESIAFPVTLYSDYVSGFGKISITPVTGGKLSVTHDRNACAPGSICTQMIAPAIIVEGKVLSDSRPVDGALTVELTKELTMVIYYSRKDFSLIPSILYFEGGNTDPIRVPLQTLISANVTRKNKIQK